MPTINDIAREAGVSHGTVSNVINGRGNVSVEKIRLVMSTAEKLGYKINSKAQSLRQGKDRVVAALLPDIGFERYAAAYEALERELSLNGYSVRLYSTRAMETEERAALTQALNARVGAVIAHTCLPNAVDYYSGEADGIPIVFLQSEGPEREGVTYAGFDPKAAGRDIGERLLIYGAKRIAVFTDCAFLNDTALFLSGFADAAPRESLIRYLDCPNHQIELRAFELFENDAYYDYIVCADRRREAAVRDACAYASRRKTPQFITVCSRSALAQLDSPVYELDDKRLSHIVAKALIANLKENQPMPRNICLENNGFRVPPRQIVPAKTRVLRLLTVDSPSSAALAKLAPHLERRENIKLNMTVLPLRDVYDVLQTPKRHDYDLIRMDVAWLDELASMVYHPIDEIITDWDSMRSRFIPELGDNYTSAEGKRFCLPYDPSTQLLFYRRDLFEDPTCKRMYFEAFREELTVPDSFAAYNRVAKFFTRALNPASPIAYGSTVAIGNVVVSPSEFMPRLFELGGSLMDELGRITLNTPLARAALDNYRETYAYSERTVYNFWENVLTGFADGSAAMTVVFINYASHILNLKMSSIAGKLGFAAVPGKMPLLGGGVIGVTPDCAEPEAARAFFSWLYSDLIAPVFTMLGGLSPCLSAYQNRDINEKYPWLSAARSSFKLARRRRSSAYYTNFSELQLENILATHLQRAVLGQCGCEQALIQAQADCALSFHAARVNEALSTHSAL